MRRQTILLSVTGVITLLVVTLTLCHSGLANDTYLDDRLKPGELCSIQRDLPRAQWAYARKAIASGHVPSFLARVRDIAFGRIHRVYLALDGYIVIESG